MGHAV